MVAGLVYAQLKGLGLEATARLATALGAYSVTRFGAGVDLEQLHGLEQQVQVENAGAEAMPAAAGNGD
jgi:sugar/nucleoside kinase (ribokinase family)